MIQLFANADAERVWQRQRVRRFGSDLQRMSNRKLLIIDAAETLNDLRVPPGNRLEHLSGVRAGQHSIRINDQWRICFTWTAAGAADVEITDYH
jgi:toxin HigB-1